MVGALKRAGAQSGACGMWSVRTSAANTRRQHTTNVRHDCNATNRVRANINMAF
jgi:hypothetical protein